MLILLLIFFAFLPQSVLAVSPGDVTITDFSSNSNPEWIQLTNNTDEDINLSSWVIKDKANNSFTIEKTCISPNLNQIIVNSSTWLNNTGDEIIYLYDAENNLIDELYYSTGVTKDQPSSSNNCVIDTPTPTDEPFTTNPNSGISLSEFMPYSSLEWIELYNQNDFDVKLVGWEIKDNDSNTKTILDLFIEANSFGIFQFSGYFLNNTGDSISIYNHNKEIVGSYSYPDNKFSLELSWSNINNSWCQAKLSQGQSNSNDCFTLEPTSIPTPKATNTPTPTPTSTPTPIPTEISTPTPISDSEKLREEDLILDRKLPTPTSSASVLGETTTEAKRNYFPLFLIIGGGLLLITPVIITKLKK